ncbi:MAG: GNAT family N-acetyltransferase [Candidatus Sericytochromatia bacterium]
MSQTITKQVNHPLHIQKAQRQEMEQVARLIRASADWYASFVHPEDLNEHFVDTAWQERNYQCRDFYLGFNEKKQAVGTLSLQYFGPYAYIGYLYLDTSQVGKRYGHRFMEFAREEALRRKKKGLCLLAHPQAHWAVKAYKKFGFQCILTQAKDILNFNQGFLNDYYEKGFHLYRYPLS